MRMITRTVASLSTPEGFESGEVEKRPGTTTGGLGGTRRGGLLLGDWVVWVMWGGWLGGRAECTREGVSCVPLGCSLQLVFGGDTRYVLVQYILESRESRRRGLPNDQRPYRDFLERAGYLESASQRVFARRPSDRSSTFTRNVDLESARTPLVPNLIKHTSNNPTFNSHICYYNRIYHPVCPILVCRRDHPRRHDVLPAHQSCECTWPVNQSV